jgi:hypothetical protein
VDMWASQAMSAAAASREEEEWGSRSPASAAGRRRLPRARQDANSVLSFQ